MIKSITDCETCRHKNVCRYKDNAKSDMNKLKAMRYGTSPKSHVRIIGMGESKLRGDNG